MIDESLESQVHKASAETHYDPRQPQSQSTLSKLGDAVGEMYQNVKELGSAVRDSSDDYSARRRGAVAGGLATAVGAGLLALGGCDGGPGTDPGNGNGNGGGGEPKIFDYNAKVTVFSNSRGRMSNIRVPKVPVKWESNEGETQRDTTDTTGTAYFAGEVPEGTSYKVTVGGPDFQDGLKEATFTGSVDASDISTSYVGEEYIKEVTYDIKTNKDSRIVIRDSEPRPFSSAPENGRVLAVLGGKGTMETQTYFSGSRYHGITITPSDSSENPIKFRFYRPRKDTLTVDGFF